MNINDLKRVPTTRFKELGDEGLLEVGHDALFANKTVVVLSLPGAFTPTCSSAHLPRYDELVPVFEGLGVDHVYCVSVNDAFTMQAWGEDLGLRNVRLLADGNGDFTDAMGMLVDKSDLGFGRRSWRYSMLVRDGVIEKIFSEAEVDGDPFAVSDAETMLRYLDPAVTIPPAVTIITRKGCSYCKQAKQLLAQRGLSFHELLLGRDIGNSVLLGLSGRQTVPQVFINGEHVGGADELASRL